MNKLLSVVIPTYNMEAMLDRCLTSFISEQEVMDKLDIVVVNDGSKDRSSQIAHGYELLYPNTFRVIDKENGNYGSCVNVGLDICVGKYFRIIDADDWVETDNLAAFLEALDKSEDDVIFTNHRKIYSERQESSSFPEKLALLTTFELDNFVFRDYNMSWFVLMHRMTYKMDLLRTCKLRLHTGISYTDTDYCFYPLIEAQTLSFFDITLYNYDCCRDGQTMSLASRIKSLSHMKIILEDMVSKYVIISSSISENRRNLLFEVFGNITCCIYQTILVDSVKSVELDKYLTEIQQLLNVDTRLKNRAALFKYNGVRCVRVWENLGLYNTNIIFRIYNHIYYRIIRYFNA